MANCVCVLIAINLFRVFYVCSLQYIAVMVSVMYGWQGYFVSIKISSGPELQASSEKSVVFVIFDSGHFYPTQYSFLGLFVAVAVLFSCNLNAQRSIVCRYKEQLYFQSFRLYLCPTQNLISMTVDV